MTDKQTDNSQASAVTVPVVDTLKLECVSFDYAGEVAAQHAASSKLRISDLIDANLHHFVGFAKAGATLGLACDRIAGATACNPDSLRRVFLGKLGNWAEFRSLSQTKGDPTVASTELPQPPSAPADQTGFTHTW